MPELRPYQKEDLQFLLKLNAAGIFSEQRTGKTPVAISYAKEKHITKTLIICPPSAIPIWTSAWPTWYQGQTCIAATGKNNSEKIQKIKQWTNALVISYDSLKTTKNTKGCIEPIKEICATTNGNPELVILDEAHRIQTRQAATTSAVYQFIKAPHKLALTGTPASNKPYQIFSILRWLYPKTFTSYWNYVDEFYNYEVKYSWSANTNYKVINDFKNETKRREHAELLNKIAVQRKRKDVMPWLPEKEYERVILQPSARQAQTINHLKTYFEVGEIETQGILDSLMRERQLCVYPDLLGIKASSPKVEWILQYIRDYPDRQILIFSKFTSFLKELAKIIKKEFPEYALATYTGETTIQNRTKIVDDFQNHRLQILLLNIDAAKEAITLDEAEVAVFTDKYPPIGSIAQAEDRFVATTEEKKNKQHNIIELCIKGTYDERLYDILQHNAEITDVINDYKKYLKGE